MQTETDPAVRIPAWLALVVAGAMAAGVALGLLATDGPPLLKIVRAVFFASAFGYAAVSILDFWEHGRLEGELGGHFFTSRAIPLWESINHVATGATVIAFLLLARQPPSTPALRDWVTVLLPPTFLALGWRDELVYHRRRCKHREDIMHTVAHLAAGLMMCSFALSKMVGWSTNL